MAERNHRGPSSFERAWRRRFIEFGRLSDNDAAIAGWSRSGLETRVRQFRAAWAGAEPGSSWLDAGCGAGTYSRILADAGAAVVSVDYSPLAVSKARAREARPCLWVVADVTRLPFRTQGFDGILCFGVTQALTDSAKAVRELAMQTRPGGEIWIDGLNAWCVANAWKRVRRWMTRSPMHLRYESPYRLGRLLREEAAAHELKLHWMPIFPESLQRWQGIVESRAAKFLLRWVPGLGLILSHSFLLCARKGKQASVRN